VASGGRPHGASLVGAHVFATQLQRIRADGADFRARESLAISLAQLRGAKFIEADLSAI